MSPNGPVAPVTTCVLEAGSLTCREVEDGEGIGLKSGSTLLDLVAPEDAGSLTNAAAEHNGLIEVDVRHTDGRHLRVRARPDNGVWQTAIFDVTDRARTDEISSIEARMLRAFSRATTFGDAVQPFVECLGRTLDLRSVEMWLNDHRTGALRLVATASSGLPTFRMDKAAAELDRATTPSGLQATAVNQGSVLWVPEIRHDPRVLRRKEALEDGVEGAIVIPLLFNTRDLGAVILWTNSPVHRDGTLEALFLRLAAQVGLVVANLRRGDLLQRSQRRLRLLADLSRALARATTPEAVARAAVDALVPNVGDRAVVERPGSPAPVRTVAAVEDPIPQSVLTEPLLPNGIDGRQRVPENDPLATISGRYAIACALEGRSKPLGRLIVLSEDEPFDHEEELLTREAARRVVAALENAEAFEQRSHIAMTLQRSLLPPSLPHIPGIDAAAFYRAAGDGIDSGGDFYDLFPTGPSSWAACVGDVQGKGPEAAAVTALARYALRATASRARRPSKTLQGLNSTLLTNDQTDRCCTVSLARIEQSGSGTSITISLAGHLQAILRASDGRTIQVGQPGQILGCLEEVRVSDDAIGFGPGDVFIMYTDGVTEARSPKGEPFGEERLLDLVASMEGKLDAADIADAVARATLEWYNGTQGDDIAILALRAV